MSIAVRCAPSSNLQQLTLIIMIATQLKFKSDNVVIATMISAAAVTYFSIGARIVSYGQQVVMALAQNFLPIASQSEATGNMDRLRKVFVAGNRFCAFTAFRLPPFCSFSASLSSRSGSARNMSPPAIRSWSS